MKKIMCFSAALAAALFILGAAGGEEELSVDTVINKANRIAYYQGNDGQADVSMTIIDSQGRERAREFTILRWDKPGDSDDFCGDQKFYIYFQRPVDVNKMVFMVWKHLDKDDDRWLYLPALDLVKRISSTEKRTSFVGSDFFYEDVSGRNLDEDTHKLLETTDNFYVLKNTPKNPEAVEFSYFKMWVHRKTFITVKVEFYDKKGEEYRIFEALEVKTIQDRPTIMKSRMKDLRTKGETVIEYSNVKYDVGLPEDIFTERYLRRAPREYLK